jgi:hypothetical protein
MNRVPISQTYPMCSYDFRYVMKIRCFPRFFLGSCKANFSGSNEPGLSFSQPHFLWSLAVQLQGAAFGEFKGFAPVSSMVSTGLN